MNLFSRGQKGKLGDMGLNGPFAATINIAAPGISVDVACFGLDANGKLSDDRFMIFYNQKSAPGNAITMSNDGNKTTFQTNLAALPDSIDKLVFAASIDAQGTMRALGSCLMSLGDATSFPFSGSDFQEEKAVIIGELYRRDGTWRFGAVGQGFNGGLSALLKHFGGTEMESAPAPSPTSAPAPAPAQQPEEKKISLSKVTLEKRGDKVSLDKRDSKGFGRIRVNLNWNQNAQATQAPQKTGFMNKMFGSREKKNSNGIDLDIGCLFQLTDGRRSAVQALGESWGSYDNAPYIQLDADDRTGSVSGGENIFINGAHFDQIKRILIYSFIYEGVANWAATNGVVTIEVPGQPPIEVRLDNGANLSMCAIAMIENNGGNIQVTKLVEYFSGHGNITAHQEMDERYGFGLRWQAGTKD